MVNPPNSLLIASQNPGKIDEFRQLLRKIPRLLSPADYPAIRIPEFAETGETYQENALIKAEACSKLFQIPVLADDSGLECEALDGRPGILSARFGGKDRSWPERWKLLNQEIQKTSSANRCARFRAILCFMDGSNSPQFYEGVVRGEILTEPRGNQGFGYDPIFLIPALGKTLAEIDTVTKNRISHRSLATQAFLKAHFP